MTQIALDLDESQQRPVVQVSNWLTALLDTGAYLPIWMDDEDILRDQLGARLLKEEVPFTGFGGIAVGNAYSVTFSLGKLIYPNMTIIANNDMKVPFNLIISATMFQNLIYEIDDKHHRLNITVPDEESLIRNLRIVDQGGRMHVLCNSADDEKAEAR